GDMIVAEIKVPELAESIYDGTISRWLKQPGDYVNKGEAVAELETDKVNVDLISEFEGVIKELLFAEGDTVQVGDTIAIIAEGEAAATVATPEKPEVKEGEAPQPV